MPPIKINHLAVVADDIESALHFWRDQLGLPVSHTEQNKDESVHIAFLPVGDAEIELIAPITDDSGVAKYLAKKGAGMHHICLEVDSISTAMQDLLSKGVELINDAPKTRPGGVKYAFVHPKSTGGVLIELYEIPRSVGNHNE